MTRAFLGWALFLAMVGAVVELDTPECWTDSEGEALHPEQTEAEDIEADELRMALDLHTLDTTHEEGR